MRPKERHETGQKDLFKARLDQIVDMSHPLAKLASAIDWGFLEARFGAVYHDGPGQPPLPTRLMAGLAILKHMHDLSDEVLCARWVEHPYYQLFCGEEFFRHKLPFDRSSMTRWRQRMGEEKLIALLQESLATATRTGAAKPADFTKIIVDTTVQPKAVAFPTDARLMHRARTRLVRLAKKHAVVLRQSYARVGKLALIQQQRYAHAKQFKRAKRSLKTLKTQLGRIDLAPKFYPGLSSLKRLPIEDQIAEILLMAKFRAEFGELENLDAFVATRRRNWQYLWDGLNDLQDILLLPAATANSDPSWFGFCITLRPEAPFDREDLMHFLNDRKIGTRLLFAGNLLRQPYMKGRNYRTIGPLENSDIVMTRTFWIGVYPGLSQQHLDYVLETMHGFFRVVKTTNTAATIPRQ